MTKGSHVVCTIMSIAARGRSYTGFTKQHAERCKVPPVSILDVTTFDSLYARPLVLRQPPPPPSPRTNTVAPSRAEC